MVLSTECGTALGQVCLTIIIFPYISAVMGLSGLTGLTATARPNIAVTRVSGYGVLSSQWKETSQGRLDPSLHRC